MDKNKKIEGSPTKELFVNILTRDLLLEDAINDLIDNCIDGAKRLRPDGNYKGLGISIEFTEKHFKVSDNCGGIPIDIARNYAFRFGRPKEAGNTDFSIGQFGVGMKRAFFKLGMGFYVESTSENSQFAILTDISKWLEKKKADGSDDWSFEFEDDFKENQNYDIKDTGTKVEVMPLHPEVVNYIKSTTFIDKELRTSIEKKQMESIYSGIEIKLNGKTLKCIRPTFRISDDISIGKFYHTFDNGVELEILYGISDPIEEEGGWYIFCNNRLLLGPEQTALTGWTGKGGDGVAIYHQQFYRFRGLVFFRAKNSFDLPWNTSKNNIDASSPQFLFARSKMIEFMKQVNQLLNYAKGDRERNEDGSEKESTPYLDIIKETKVVEFQQVSENYIKEQFVFTKFVKPKEKPKNIRISYTKPIEIVNKVKKALSARSATQAGEMTFDYFIRQEEIGDYE